MFKNSRELDRQYTSASFRLALRRYADNSERWYDGTPDSVDARLGSCNRLLHSVRSAVNRLSVTDAVPFLNAVNRLETDKRALVALREDLLSGASNRADVLGPPGWRLAQESDRLHGPFAGYDDWEDCTAQNSDASDPDAYCGRIYHQVEEGRRRKGEPLTNFQDKQSSRRMAQPSAMAPQTPAADTSNPIPRGDVSGGVGRLPAAGANSLPMAGNAAQPSIGPTMGTPPITPTAARTGPTEYEESPAARRQEEALGGYAQLPRELMETIHQRGYDPEAEYRRRTEQTRDYIKRKYPDISSKYSALDSPDRRWVTLEAAKFVAANTDTLDDSHELATRAHHHAQVKTSTFTPARSAAISEVFVATVCDLGRRSQRPVVRTASTLNVDFAPEAMFL